MQWKSISEDNAMDNQPNGSQLGESGSPPIAAPLHQGVSSKGQGSTFKKRFAREWLYFLGFLVFGGLVLPLVVVLLVGNQTRSQNCLGLSMKVLSLRSRIVYIGQSSWVPTFSSIWFGQ
jgi:hypothetical protein